MDGEANFYTALNNYKEQGSLESEIRLYCELKTLSLYVPIELIGDYKRVMTIQKNGIEEYAPAFTSPSEYDKLPSKQAKLAMLSFDDLKHMLLDDGRDIKGIVINPSGNAVIFPLEGIRRVDSVASGIAVQKTDGVFGGIHLAVPENYLSGLASAIKRFMGNKPEVTQVNLYRAKRNMADKAHWLFWVHFNGLKIDLFPELANLIQRFMKPGEVFELVQGTGNMHETHAAGQSIIYRKQT